MIFDPTFRHLESGMKRTSAKQAIYAHNIANAGNPDFEALEFDEELGRAVKRLDSRKVILEEEMAALSENSVRYSSYVKLMSSKLGILRTIATQGRK